jgi:hypothetical protein
MSIELISGLVMGLAFVALGAVVGFARPTEEEAGADPRMLRWGRRPAIRRRLGLLIMAMGVTIFALRLWMVAR